MFCSTLLLRWGCAQSKRNKRKHSKGVHFVLNSCPSPDKTADIDRNICFSFFYAEKPWFQGVGASRDIKQHALEWFPERVFLVLRGCIGLPQMQRFALWVIVCFVRVPMFSEFRNSSIAELKNFQFSEAYHLQWGVNMIAFKWRCHKDLMHIAPDIKSCSQRLINWKFCGT